MKAVSRIQSDYLSEKDNLFSYNVQLKEQKQNSWSPGKLRGKIIELLDYDQENSLSLACDLIWKLQLQGEPCAWISANRELFFPPDAEHFGIDLKGLAVIKLKTVLNALSAAEKLLRSGAFGAIIIDIGFALRLPEQAFNRLQGLARKHSSSVLFIRQLKNSGQGLSPLVSLRFESLREAKAKDLSKIKITALKDKNSGPGWHDNIELHTHMGLC